MDEFRTYGPHIVGLYSPRSDTITSRDGVMDPFVLEEDRNSIDSKSTRMDQKQGAARTRNGNNAT